MGISASAVTIGTVHLGIDSVIAQGAILRSRSGSIRIGHGSLFLENGVMVGGPGFAVAIGSKVVFGHRCLVLGATIGDLCEVGNSTILMPGARLGSRCMTGEGTLIQPGMVLPDDSVVLGRPCRIVRKVSKEDLERVRRLRGGDLSVPAGPLRAFHESIHRGKQMGKLYAFRDRRPAVSPSAFLFDSAEITGDVTIGKDSIIGAGVKIIGDSHGPVRIGNRVQILENAVLHLLPDNALVIEDDVIVGPGSMIHGCRIGRGSLIEPGAIVCDYSRLGAHCIVKAGSLVKQRDEFPDGSVIEGFPGKSVGRTEGRPEMPPWALRMEDLHDAGKID